MAGHPYGQFGAAPGGPSSRGIKTLYCLVPLLTVGVFGTVPSLVLAVRRRRAVDVVGAVVFGALQLTMYVCLGLKPGGSTDTVYDIVGAPAMVLLWLAAPVHFLLMDTRRFWGAALPQPGTWQPSMHPSVPPPPASYAPAGVMPGVMPAVLPPQPAATPPAPADDLQQLGELLRRQVREGGQP